MEPLRDDGDPPDDDSAELLHGTDPAQAVDSDSDSHITVNGQEPAINDPAAPGTALEMPEERHESDVDVVAGGEDESERDGEDESERDGEDEREREDESDGEREVDAEGGDESGSERTGEGRDECESERDIDAEGGDGSESEREGGDVSDWWRG